MTAPAAPAPGYYTDPLDPASERWWDGAGWTDTIRPLEAPVLACTSDEVVVPRLADVERGEVPALAPSPSLATRAPQVQPTGAPAAEPQPFAEAQPPAEPAPVAPPTVPPGFYPDPYGQAPLRWFDGVQWTTATSQLQPAATNPSAPAEVAPGTVPATVPATVPRAQPGSADEGYGTGMRPGRAGSSSVLPVRGGDEGGRLSSLVRRVGLPGLAAVLVLAVALGVRLFVLDTGPAASAPAQLAAAINLRNADLPAGWKTVAKSDPKSDTATAGPAAAPAKSDDPMAAFDRDISRCIGGADPATSIAFTSASPSWSRGSSEISSEVVVLRSVALAQQDLHARQGKTVDACMRRVGVPAMRAALAPS
ncbi:MAG: hypothetical protein QOG60_1618, partial [Frankiaceae bacterium]|nr:hypothetical protein [Frankiaceae bacterium]